MSSVLVLGSGGFIGGEVALGLVRSGYKVYGLTKSERNSVNLVKNEIIPIITDVKDVDYWLPIALKVDIIIDAIADFSDENTPNKILEALTIVSEKNPSTTIIYTSGSLIYGDNKQVVDESLPYRQHDFSDWRGKIEQGYQKINAIIIQPSFIYGKNHSYAGYFFEAATKTDGLIKIYGNPNLYQGFIHIYDVVRFFTLVIQNSSALKGQKLIANGYSEKIQDLVTLIAVAAGKKSNPTIEYVEAKKDILFTQTFAFNQKLSFSKATHLIGYYPAQPSLTDDIERYYKAWLLSKDKGSIISNFIESILP